MNRLLWMFIFVGALLATGGLAVSTRAQSVPVYAVEYNQATNRFGTVNLLNGSFTEIASIGKALINDIAYCPTNGTLYGISNTTALVTFNQTNGAITKVANLSTNTIESLAFRPRDGVLFGATSSKLYTINPANGTATLVGSYGTPKNLGTGENIRFAQDGNLYVSDEGTNTDIYRINTTNGAATWMGEATGYPYLMLQNASSNMYGVYINLGSSTNPSPKLVTFNLNSFVNGGTNANGSTNQIIPMLVGAGTNFPANFNFSGNVPQAVTNLTVPVSATGPSNQTAVVGGNVVFSTVASGTGPYNYAWSENGVAISGQTNSSLTLNNVTTAAAATYSVIVGGAMGTVTNSATLTVTKASGSITLGSLSQTYTGLAEPATATTIPSGLAVTFIYNGSANAPTNAGSYTVIGTINDSNYQGSATNTMIIAQASGSITLGSLNQTYSGLAEPATATTTPSGLAVTFTYNGSATVPTNAGSYTVIGTINNANYQGSATNTMIIAQASGSITLGSLSQTYSGSPKAATATTTPTGLAVTFTYNGSATVPANAGSYTVIGTINNANYQGSATNTLVINAATLTYTANAVGMTYGSAVPGLSGSVSGFLGTDNQGNATTGTMVFTTGASSTSVVGSYAINGSGLAANNGNYIFVQATANATALTINALPVTLTGTRSYDGTTAVASGILTVANKVGSDNVTVAAGSGTLAGANVGSEAIASFGTLNLGGTAAGNYTLAGASGSVNITVSALALTVTNLLALDKVYDGTTNTTLDATNAGLAGVLNGDDVTLVTSNAVAYFADKNVGTNKPVTVTGLALGGAAAANYTLVDPTNVTADISAAGLTVAGVTAASKVYDGTTNAQLNGTATLNGEVSGDDVSLVTDGMSAAFAGPNVGTSIPVTVSGYTITGADAGNYTLTQPTGLTADITAAPLTITATANTKIYDGTTSAAAIPTTSGLQSSDTVTGLAETYDTPNAGTGKTLSVSAFTVNDGNNGNNYTVSTVSSTAGVIAQASGSVSLGSLNQTYNGSAEAATATTIPSGLAVSFTYNGSATVPTSAGSYTVVGTINDPNYQGSATGTLVIAQASGSITLGSLNQTYSDSAEAATATTVPSGLAVSFTYNGSATVPTAAGTYTVVATINDPNYQGSATGTLVISKGSASITLGNLSQTYTGSAEAAMATTTPSGLAVTFTYNGSATVPTAAGTYTVVAAINDANYQGSATGTLVIAQASGSITLGSLSQNYDGSAKAATATTIPSGLAVSFTYNGSATVPTAAGTYTVVGTINDANYQGSTTGTLMINTITLTVTNLLALDKVYDGTTNATLDATNAGLAGVLNGDDVTLVTSNAAAYFADKNVNTNKPVTVTGLALGGAAAANYTLVDPTNVTANITAAELTLTGVTAASKVYDGTTNAQLNGTATLNGEVSGDDVSLVTDGVSAAFAGPNVGTGIPVTVSGYALTGADAGNYTLTQPSDLAADITAATLTITATANAKIYDGTTSAVAIPTVNGLQGSDSVSGLAETYDTKNTGTGKTLNVSAFTVNDGNAGGNYTVSSVANTAGVITPATLTVTADNKSKICGLPNPPLTASYNGFVGGDNTSVLSSPAVLSTTATTTSGAGQYPITVSGAAAANYTIQDVNGTLLVISAPQLAGAKVSVNGMDQFVVSCPTIAGQTYQLEYTTCLTTTWTPLGTPFAGTDGIVAVTNSMSVTPQCFFRVEVQ